MAASSDPVEGIEFFEPDEELVRMTAELRKAIEDGTSEPWTKPEDAEAYMERWRRQHR